LIINFYYFYINPPGINVILMTTSADPIYVILINPLMNRRNSCANFDFNLFSRKEERIWVTCYPYYLLVFNQSFHQSVLWHTQKKN